MADDCALAGYFSRLLGILLSRSAEQILGFLKANSLTLRPCPLCKNATEMGVLNTFTAPVCISREDKMAQTDRLHYLSLGSGWEPSR